MKNDSVWIVMSCHVEDYVDVYAIVMVCTTEELAKSKLKWLEEDKSTCLEYWIEEHILETP